MGASSRVRLLQHVEFLEKNKVHVSEFHFFSSDQLQNSYLRGSHSLLSSITSYFLRFRQLLAYRGKLMIIEKELFPYLPYFIEKWFLKTPYIVDIDDAVHVQYTSSNYWLVRILLKRKIEKILAGSQSVLAGSEFLVNFATNCNAERVSYIPSSVPEILGHIISPKIPRASKALRICWIGSPSTGQYLESIKAFISKASMQLNVKFIFIGVSATKFSKLLTGNVEYISWSADTEYEIISGCDVGIMPLPDGPFERGKCSYKLIQYMACGLPVLASPVGENLNVLEHGFNGYFCSDTKDWLHYLSILYEKSDLRVEMGKKSLAKFRENYSSSIASAKLLNEIYYSEGKN